MVVHGRVVEYGVVVIRWQRVLCNSVEEWDVVVICHQLIIARVPSTALGDCINRVFFFLSTVSSVVPKAVGVFRRRLRTKLSPPRRNTHKVFVHSAYGRCAMARELMAKDKAPFQRPRTGGCRSRHAQRVCHTLWLARVQEYNADFIHKGRRGRSAEQPLESQIVH